MRSNQLTTSTGKQGRLHHQRPCQYVEPLFLQAEGLRPPAALGGIQILGTSGTRGLGRHRDSNGATVSLARSSAVPVQLHRRVWIQLVVILPASDEGLNAGAPWVLLQHRRRQGTVPADSVFSRESRERCCELQESVNPRKES